LNLLAFHGVRTRCGWASRAPFDCLNLSLFVLFLLRAAAAHQAGRQYSDKYSETENDSDTLVRILANLSIGKFSPESRSLPGLFGAGFQEVLSVLNHGFKVIQKFIQIGVFSISCFAHSSEHGLVLLRYEWGIHPWESW
jgi:hypothetical protein